MNDLTIHLNREKVLELVEEVKEYYKKNPYYNTDRINYALAGIALFRHALTKEEFETAVNDIYTIRAKALTGKE